MSFLRSGTSAEHADFEMSAMEGQPAPKLRADEWIGDPVEPASIEGRVTVLRFLSPLSRMTRESMSRWRKTTGELGPQGVTFLGVCDHLADWDRMKALVGEGSPPFPIARDVAPDDEALPLGVTAASYGVRMWPTTVVIDRSGQVRAAGIDERHLGKVIEKLMAEPIELENCEGLSNT